MLAVYCREQYKYYFPNCPEDKPIVSATFSYGNIQFETEKHEILAQELELEAVPYGFLLPDRSPVLLSKEKLLQYFDSRDLYWEFIEDLMKAGCDYEEILQEVEVSFNLDKTQALTAIQGICNRYADGAPDAMPSHKEAANLDAWATAHIKVI
jgi:hypothetical protein